MDAPDPELLEVYRAEAVEIVETVHGHLLRIEQGAPDRDERLEDVLRLAHDIKGSARVVGYALVGRLAHALEACLLLWRGRAEVPRGWSDLAFRASDHIRALSLDPSDAELVARAEALEAELRVVATAPAPAEPAAEPAVAPAAPHTEGLDSTEPLATSAATLRVARAGVDAVSDDAAVTLMDTLGVDEHLRALSSALEDLFVMPPPRVGASPSEVRRARVGFEGGRKRARDAHRALADAVRQLQGHARELDQHARALRLAPATPLFTHFERVARDTAAALGRDVRVQAEGRELLVDVLLLEALKGPLTHAVRNAIDHGLEPAGERVAAGKPPFGTLRLVLREEGDRLLVQVHDDGRGIDLRAVRRKLGARAGGLDDERVLALLMRAGVSTRDTVSTLSGRGLGLGATAVLADRLRGTSRLATRPGSGTALLVELPLQLSLIQALIVRSGGLSFALPATTALPAEAAGPGTVALATVLGLSTAPPAADSRVLCLRADGDEARVAVDAEVRLLSVVQRPLPAHLGELPCVQGATILPGGRPALLLDPRGVAEACLGARRAPVRRSILLADDSATLRAKLCAELSAAGYDVEVASDGAEALARLCAREFDAVVSDVQMPRRDGFDVAAACAGRRPCVLVTAQPGPDGAARASSLGAAYLGKEGAFGARVLAALQDLLPVPVETSP